MIDHARYIVRMLLPRKYVIFMYLNRWQHHVQKTLSREEINVKTFRSIAVHITIRLWDESRNRGSFSGNMQCIFSHSKTSRIALSLTMSLETASRLLWAGGWGGGVPGHEAKPVAYRPGGDLNHQTPEIPKAFQKRAKLNLIVKTVKNC